MMGVVCGEGSYMAGVFAIIITDLTVLGQAVLLNVRNAHAACHETIGRREMPMFYTSS